MQMLGAWGAQGNPGVLTEGAGCVWFWGSSPADKSAKLVEMRLVWLGDPILSAFLGQSPLKQLGIAGLRSQDERGLLTRSRAQGL